jgi:hypothetical protein
MMFQIEYLIHEYFLKTNKNITDLINHEYIKRLFSFNRRFMQTSFYTFMIKKFGLLTCHCPNRLWVTYWLLSQDMHKIIFIY